MIMTIYSFVTKCDMNKIRPLLKIDFGKSNDFGWIAIKGNNLANFSQSLQFLYMIFTCETTILHIDTLLIINLPIIFQGQKCFGQ